MFYHGTPHKISGNEILPACVSGKIRPGEECRAYATDVVFLTTSKTVARQYGADVYEVQPVNVRLYSDYLTLEVIPHVKAAEQKRLQKKLRRMSARDGQVYVCDRALITAAA